MHDLGARSGQPHRDAPRELNLRVDWRAYWHAFMAEHGEPEEWSGRCWFPDGWSYSAFDHRGPEWPPPVDPEELRQVQIKYWTQRRAFAARRFERLRIEIENVLSLVEAKPGLLRAVEVDGKEVTALSHVAEAVQVRGDDVLRSKVLQKRYPFLGGKADLASKLRGPQDELRRAIAECDEKLEELNRA